MEDWGHAYVVPLISAYFVYKYRERLSRIAVHGYWPGLVPLLLGVALYVYFVVGYANHMFQGFAMVIAFGGLVLLVAGPRMLRALSFPIAYLGFMVTISELVMNKITWQLKLIASKGSYVALNMFGVDTELTGNILEITNGVGEVLPLNVADACSGMRMVVAFVALAAAVVMFSCEHWWQRVAVLLTAVPIAILMNVVRVVVLGLLTLINPDLAVGEAHTLIGTLLLLPALGLFMLCVWVFDQLVRAEPAEVAGA
jgi:exosortase